jgi:heme/copper-type cytochrome/quinol oxidase subunit 4
LTVASADETKRAARALFVTWVVLVSLTLGSFWLADSSAATASRTILWVLGFAVLKSHLITGVFMELRRGPRGWALLMSAFLFAEAALIAAILP